MENAETTVKYFMWL